ncbi:MAG: DUF4350 domain-containing protein [Planctomycetota bacterium]
MVPSPRRVVRASGLEWAAAILCLSLTGCPEQLQTEYGRLSGPGASQSVNGTAVLADMFEQAGHRVRSWHALTPRLRERAECIVWFPDDFNPPGEEVRDWLGSWLLEQEGRTLIYVSREFDAAPVYWETVQPIAPPARRPLIASELQSSKTSFRADLRGLARPISTEWFDLESLPKSRRVKQLQGDDAWLSGVDPAKTDIRLFGRVVPADDAEVLLQDENEVLVSRSDYNGSQLVVVANGSFLLNFPLVNHEHRKLAGRLIETIGPAPQHVVFLESGRGGPPIRDDDPSPEARSGLDFLLMWPVVWAFIHFSVAGILFCCARWPIFGVARQLPPDPPSDFGKHIDAVGELLERSGDEAYAHGRLILYRQATESK